MESDKNGGVELISIKSFNVDKMADTNFKEQSDDKNVGRSEIISDDEDRNDIKLVGASDKVRPNHYDGNERLIGSLQNNFTFPGNFCGRDVSGYYADDHLFRRHSAVS